MKNETKTNEMTAEEQQHKNTLMEQFVVEASENTMLRAHSRHSIRIGNVELDVIPMDKNQSLEDVMKQFAKFAKLMQKLHGDAHLNGSNKSNASSGDTGLFQ